jgi:phenylpyruvate tautomerase PptA (4-oxalocrotonate tautomerase family)
LWPRQQLGKSRFIASIATALKALFNQKEAIVTVIANEVKQSPIAAISILPQSETFAAFP